MLLNEKPLCTVFLSILTVIVLISYSETLAGFLALWSSEDNPAYSHGLLLAAVCGLIIFSVWRNKSRLCIRPSIWPVVILFFGSLIWFVAGLGTIQIIQMLMLMLIMSMLFWAVLGFKEARPFFFPVLLLLGATPIWDVFGYYLQSITAFVVGVVVKLTIIPSMREGTHILIPAGTFDVAEGCSGKNYFIVGIIISAIFCNINNVQWKKVPVYVISAMLISIISNLIRVYIIVLSGQLTNMQSYFVTVEHQSLGWVIFMMGITVYLWLAHRSLPKAKVVTGDAQDNWVNDIRPAPLNIPRFISFFILLLAALVIGPLLNLYYQSKYEEIPDFRIEMPDDIGVWRKGAPHDDYRPYFGQGLLSAEAGYLEKESNKSIYVYMDYYYTQTQGEEAVNDLHRITDGRLWQTVSEKYVAIGVIGFGDVLEARVVSRNGQEKLIWQWYETNNKRVGREVNAKLQNILGMIQGDPSVKVMIVATDIHGDLMAARTDLKRFLQQARNNIGIQLF